MSNCAIVSEKWLGNQGHVYVLEYLLLRVSPEPNTGRIGASPTASTAPIFSAPRLKDLGLPRLARRSAVRARASIACWRESGPKIHQLAHEHPWPILVFAWIGLVLVVWLMPGETPICWCQR